MIKLSPIIERIRALLAEDSEQSVTYGALEARLALEKVAYDRLRQCHDYISHEQLKRWQPHAVVNTLLAEVDDHAIHTRTLKMSRKPAVAGVKPDDDDFVEIGTEIGFNPKLVGELWNALSGLALHVRLPKNKEDHIAEYGEKARIRAKVEDALMELERLAKGTMTFSGIGEEVHFECSCGEKNRRRASLLREGQIIHCINPDCKVSWKATKEGDEFTFESQTVDIACESCKALNLIPWRWFAQMKHDQVGSFSCHTCRHKNFVQWRLCQVRPTNAADEETPARA